MAVARALAGQPAIIFADEPTGNLDSRTSADILYVHAVRRRDLGQTIVMVTHDPNAASYADHVVFLTDGKIAMSWPTPLPTPSSPACAGSGTEHVQTRPAQHPRPQSPFALTSLAIVLGASFVVASFATADGLRSVFGQLSDDIYVDMDLGVKGKLAFGDEQDGTSSGVPADVVVALAGVDGIDVVEARYSAFNPPTTPVKSDGDAVKAGFAPVAGINWTESNLNNLYLLDRVPYRLTVRS